MSTMTEAADDGFWREQLPDPDDANPLPMITGQPQARGGVSERLVALDEAEVAALAALAPGHGGRAVILAVWAFVLSRYTRSRTVMFGSVRPRGAVAGGGAGTTLTVLPVLFTVDPDEAPANLVARVAASLGAIDEHARTSPPGQALAGHPGRPVFDTAVAYAAGPVGLAPTPAVDVAPGRVGVPVVLTVADGPSPSVRLEHDPGLLDDPAAADLVAAFRSVLRAFARDPGALLHTIGLLDPLACSALVASTNPPPVAPSEETVVASFLAWAARRPEHIAVVCGDERVGYGDLAVRVEALAGRLAAAGIGPGSVVGVFLERGPRLVAGLLAVLRAGGAFLPLDPVLPDRRIGFALRDSGARVLLTEDLLAARGAALAPPRRRLQTVSCDGDGGPGPAAVPLPTADDLAYVTYTSGSTGVPKGVAIDHRSLATNTRSVARSYDIDGDDVVVQFSSINFDAALEQMLLPLTMGGTSLLRGPELWDPVTLLGVLRAEGATVLELTPQYGYEVASSLERDASLTPEKLRLLILGGEAVATGELARWRRLMPGLRLVVGYGPTEVTITTSGWTYDPARGAGEVAPLGRLLAHLRAYIVDEELHPVPLRVPGEICLGGSGVARGYAGQPSMTAAKFLPDPFVGLSGARMYRSGDIGAWRSDGDLEFLGRSDEQVKIRGTRVEPGETEAALRRQVGVAAAVVIVVAGQTSRQSARLVGYVTPADPAAWPDPERLRAALATELAPAAVPSVIVVLPALPLTANGKLDRAALPSAPAPTPRPDKATASGGSDAERVLREVWSEVLGVPDVGPDDDFFALGGNSLAMLQVSAQLRQVAGYEIPLRQFFRTSTVSSLAQAIQRGADGHG